MGMARFRGISKAIFNTKAHPKSFTMNYITPIFPEVVLEILIIVIAWIWLAGCDISYWRGLAGTSVCFSKSQNLARWDGPATVGRTAGTLWRNFTSLYWQQEVSRIAGVQLVDANIVQSCRLHLLFKLSRGSWFRHSCLSPLYIHEYAHAILAIRRWHSYAHVDVKNVLLCVLGGAMGRTHPIPWKDI